ncbi:MAG: hypothetical protein KDH08_04310 [Anaerolineae bacterium]|nr:hypothetical protein [bacterium]MBK8168309.1 hypothetical protein [bacterium]MCB0237861.1 hypothetical protein [Anaerolineae bacterium]MCH9837339.1 hypothetical protein [bacterium]
MVTAARIARLFGMDPLAVLDADSFEFSVRAACAQVVLRDMEKEVSDGR